MLGTNPPFRADHAGSVLRPRELLAESDQWAKLARIVEVANEVWGTHGANA